MNQSVNPDNQAFKSTLGATHKPVKDSNHAKASESDHAMFLGMMALIEQIGTSEGIGSSLADLSKTLYDTEITNGMNRIKEMQQELSALTYLQNQFSGFHSYFAWKQELENFHAILNDPHADPASKMIAAAEIKALSGHPPAHPPIPSGVSKYMDTAGNFPNLSSMRTYVNDFSQQINTENNCVENNKQLPDALQSQVRTMVNDQSEYASEVASFLRLMSDQLQFS